MFERRDQRAGERGALDPMKMDMMPLAHAPKKTDLPGQVLGETTSGDGVFVVTAIGSCTGILPVVIGRPK